MNLTDSDVQSILKIIDAAEHLQEIEIVHGGFRLHVVRNGAGALRRPAETVTLSRPAMPAAMETKPAPGAAPLAPNAATPPPPVAPGPPATPAVPEGVVAIRAPMLGVFYRAPAPGEKPFVEVGQRVRADDTVCLLEVMKLFNSIRASVDGEVVKILAENGSMVEFDQPMIFVKPSKD
jgi:acetyl-CoA carboxylase biotin carboxyl carrier protein